MGYKKSHLNLKDIKKSERKHWVTAWRLEDVIAFEVLQKLKIDS